MLRVERAVNFRSSILRVLWIALSICAQRDASADDPVEQLPELIGPVSAATHQCRSIVPGGKEVDGSVIATIGIDPSGRPISIAIPEETEPVLAQFARCAALKLRFKPGIRDGTNVSGSLQLQMSFPLPPRMREVNSRLINRCFQRLVPDPRVASRFVVDVQIEADGSVSRRSLPDDAEPWMEKVADCVLARLTFIPGRLDGRPVAAQASLPLVSAPFGFSADLRALQRPSIVATESQIEDAYRDCYPDGLDIQRQLDYKITVSTLGAVMDAVIVRSSGDSRIDEAGICILKRLPFEPAVLEGEIVQTTVTWSILIRPLPEGS